MSPPTRQVEESRPTFVLAIMLFVFAVPIARFVGLAIEQLRAPYVPLAQVVIGLAIASAFALLYGVCATFIVRAARCQGLVIATSTIPISDTLRARLRAAEGPRQRIAYDGPDRVVLLLGEPAARLRVAPDPDEEPLRVDVELGSGGYRESASARIVVRALGTPSAGAGARAAERIAALMR